MSYVPPHLRGKGAPSSGSGDSSKSNYPYGKTIQMEEEYKPKTVIAGQDSIDTYEILKKGENLSMAEKLAISAVEASASRKGGKQNTKRQAQLKLEKETIISDKNFYDIQIEQSKKPLEKVILSSSVLTQIVQHAESKKFENATGQLLGSCKDGLLSVSTAFSIEGDQSLVLNKAIVQMENNYCFDNVGWYATVNLDSHLDMSTIAAQYKYQRANGNQCIFLAYDTSTSDLKGVMRLKAYRLSDEFMEIIKTVAETNQSTSLKNSTNKQQQEEELKKQIQLKVEYNGLPPELPHIDKASLNNIKNLYKEIPIEYRDNQLLTAFLNELDSELALDTYCEERDNLDLNTREWLQKRFHGLYSSQKEFKKLSQDKDSSKGGLEHAVVFGRIRSHVNDIRHTINEGQSKVNLVGNILQQRE